MFGGFMNFTWNPTTKKLTLVRKIPDGGHNYKRLVRITATGNLPGSIITLDTGGSPWQQLNVGDSVVITNCPVSGYNGSYIAQSVSPDYSQVTVIAASNLASTEITGFDATRTNVYSPLTDSPAENVLLWIYNYKPDSMILNDYQAFPWIQDYSMALCKHMLGEAREKFAQIAGPQGGTQLNGAALKAEAKAELEVLEDEIKRFIDGSKPYTWVVG